MNESCPATIPVFGVFAIVEDRSAWPVTVTVLLPPSLPCAPAGSVAALTATCTVSLPSADAIAFTARCPSTPSRWPRRSRSVACDLVAARRSAAVSRQPGTEHQIARRRQGVRDVDRAAVGRAGIADRGGEVRRCPARHQRPVGERDSLVGLRGHMDLARMRCCSPDQRPLRWDRQPRRRPVVAECLVAGHHRRRDRCRTAGADGGQVARERQPGRGCAGAGAVAELAAGGQRERDGAGVARPGP